VNVAFDSGGLSGDGKSDDTAMRWALEEAEEAGRADEVPVGAVIVCEGRVVGRGRNRTRELQDPTAHAEMIAIRAAAAELGSWRLLDCTMFVTLEPCAMCAGALVLARLPRLAFGAADPKSGACGSLRNVVADPRLNHRLSVAPGILETECGSLLTRFFRERRGAGPSDHLTL